MSDENFKKKINSLLKFYFCIFIQLFTNIFILNIAYDFFPDFNNFFYTLILFFSIVLSLIFIFKFQNWIKSISFLSLGIGIILGFMGSLLFIDKSAIYITYICIVSGLFQCSIYFRYLTTNFNIGGFILIITGINSIIISIIYFTFFNEILILIMSWFSLFYFSFCLVLYSNFLVHNKMDINIGNNPFFNSMAFTFEMYVFPYTFMIDLYYRNFDFRKNINFSFIAI